MGFWRQKQGGNVSRDVSVNGLHNHGWFAGFVRIRAREKRTHVLPSRLEFLALLVRMGTEGKFAYSLRAHGR